ncbi:MAG: NapC/NirT family cytochrome c [Chromatiales bacterium]|nr:NapC/NirT family cytochrome c [Gammaproteobacteria bacterium]MCP5353023.1 NapC/NirT family cytochrome c [Chromatiales bacterium]
MRRDPFEPERQRGVFGALVLILIGAGLVIGLDFGLRYTNSNEFCQSCHSMQWVAAETRDSSHAHNPSGVTAGCADCHVPRETKPLLWAKLMAARDVWAEINGHIDTEAKFEARRFELAERVWERMLATDSRECRACHDARSMDASRQDELAARKHAQAEKDGQTCIECHKGLAHKMPAEPVVDNIGAPLDPVPAPEPRGPIELPDLNLQPTPVALPLNLPTAPATLDRSFLIAAQCTACHGVDGISAGPGTPSIAGLSRDYLAEVMRDMRSGKVPSTIMGRLLGGLSEADIDALAAHFSKLPYHEADQVADGEQANLGRRLHKRYCDKCHGDGGLSVEEDAGILAGQWRPYLEASIAAFRAGERPMGRKMGKAFEQLIETEGDAGFEALLNYYAN